MLKEIICLVFSFITGIGGVLLTGLPQYVMPHIHWPDFGFVIGVYTGLVLLVLAGITIFAFCFSIYPGLVFLCATLSFVLTTILVNLTYYHISFWTWVVSIGVTFVVLLLLFSSLFGDGGGYGGGDSSYDDDEYPLLYDSDESTEPDIEKTKRFVLDRFPSGNGPKYIGDNGVRLYQSYRDDIFEGDNGVTYTVNYRGELEGSDGSTYRFDSYYDDEYVLV